MFFKFDQFGLFLRNEGLEEAACFALVVGFIMWVGMLAALSRVLGRVAPENRRMEPGEVWVNLIPVVNLVWSIVTVERVGESVRAELQARGRAKTNDSYGKTSALIALVLIGVFILLPPAGVVTLPFALVYAGVYWFQMNGYAKRVREEPAAPEPIDEGW